MIKKSKKYKLYNTNEEKMMINKDDEFD